MAEQKKVDVVTVGAGWTAGILAQQLTDAGYSVVSIEQGPERYTYPDFQHNHDQLRFSVRYAMMVDLARETWTWRPNPNAPSLPMRQFGSFNPGQGTGGAGVHWAAQTWRFLPSDFRYRSHHIERYGEAKLPEGNRIQDWPLTYDELEPFYDQFEYDTGVSGQAGNLNGERIEGGNIFEGPRKRPYPLPPLAPNIATTMFMDACRNLGHNPFMQPASILSQAYTDLSGRTRSACIYCGFCVRFGCEVDAKSSAVVSHIPMALATGRYQIRHGCKVTRVNLGSDGLATGVTYIDLADGTEHTQPADVVILSAFTLENVRLLLLSRGEQHPNGIGNDRSLVGTNYTYQLSQTPASGIFEGRRFNSYMGNSAIRGAIYDFNGDNFDHSDLDFIGGAGVYAGGGERDPVTTAGDLPQRTSNQESPGGQEGGSSGTAWGMSWKQNLRDNWDSVIGVSIQGESLPYDDQFLDLDPRFTDRLGQPLLRITFDFHENDYNLYRYLAQRSRDILREMGPTHEEFTEELDPYNIDDYQSTHNTGGAIMGSDPGNSVTNKYGQVWDTPNVFVTGAALYPQNPGANPTGTLCALAYYTADAMKRKYFDDPNRIMS